MPEYEKDKANASADANFNAIFVNVLGYANDRPLLLILISMLPLCYSAF